MSYAFLKLLAEEKENCRIKERRQFGSGRDYGVGVGVFM